MDERLTRALAAIDAANDADPNRVDHPHDADTTIASETLYGRRMSEMLARFAPAAGAELQVAVRAQHLCRWKIARSDYPEGRAGYKRWRSDLARLHAELLAGILAEVGYEDAFVARARALVLKQRIHTDAEAQILEDVACLVFLEHYFADFSAKHEADKLVDIVRKTWRKMSDRGHAAALALELAPEQGALVSRALA
jgi:hypothetical protein